MFRSPQREVENAEGKPATKRQKLNADDTKTAQSFEYNRNTHLKGRRRFNADLQDLQDAVHAGFTLHGLKLRKIVAGEDEGSVEIVISSDSSPAILSANLLVSDTSEYPSNHSLFCYSPDDLSAKLQRVIDDLAEEAPRTLGETVSELVASVARVVGQVVAKPVTPSSSDESDDCIEDYDAFDDYDDFGVVQVQVDSIMSKLQQDFVDIVATEYRPGYIRIGGDDFVLSVSLPVITLANSIPPRALMAWDRRLLESSQHLTLLIGGFHSLYPVLEHDATYTSSAQRLGASLTFKVGLSQKYKPGSEQVKDIVRKHGLILQDAEDELRIQAELAAQKAKVYDLENDEDELMQDIVDEEPPVQEEVIDPDRFDRFSLSNSLETLMDQNFLKIVQLRRKFSLGWAGAELLNSETERSQRKDDDVFSLLEEELRRADNDERKLGRTTVLPLDPLVGLGSAQHFNLPLTAFCYLIRRLSLCTRYCIVCHNKINTNYEALKPYVCDSKLCSFQYYLMNRGPSLEYEILHNPKTVDLLISLAYVSASEGVLEDPLPTGLGLRVPMPSDMVPVPVPNTRTGSIVSSGAPQNEEVKVPIEGPDGLCDFDDLNLNQMRSSIAKLIHTLPSVEDMKKHLERKVNSGKYKPKLKDINSNVSPAAWSILRWCVASCTAHIEAIESGEEHIKGLDKDWTQFRLTVGAPDAEAKFNQALKEEQKSDRNLIRYPVIYAFHGSPLRNWHSIIRHGLWYKVIANGRAYGDGVYLARDANTSSSYYSGVARSSWQKSLSSPSHCMALAEVINRPAKFVSSNPHYVVKDTHWIMCRYLLVKGTTVDPDAPVDQKGKGRVENTKLESLREVPFVQLDPKHQTTVGGTVISIPDPAFQVESLLSARKNEHMHQDPDEADMAIFELDTSRLSTKSTTQLNDHDPDNDVSHPEASSSIRGKAKPVDDWVSDVERVTAVVENLAFPPLQSSPSASMAIQRELKSMIKEQEMAPSFKELGWYMPPQFIGDNLYQWIVELHSLDDDLPLARDMKAQKLNSIIFEIRFPPTFPNSPPFFRIITPRFLPFIHGGGGHVTGGGSICMDLLTSDGWLPSYSISAVLMQIRLALSNLEPRPARLSVDWNRSYGVEESLAGYKRAAATHRWTLPEGLDKLVR